VFTDGNSLIEDFSVNGLSKYDRGQEKYDRVQDQTTGQMSPRSIVRKEHQSDVQLISWNDLDKLLPHEQNQNQIGTPYGRKSITVTNKQKINNIHDIQQSPINPVTSIDD
tara:strand:- start:92 stop:421 length:330 start_codon:yes stop_codon:yes gene_type:complete